MATAVLDIDLRNLPPQIDGLEHYQKAFILLRFNGKPIGKKILPVKNGRIIIKEHYSSLVDEEIKQHLAIDWFHNYLNYDEREVIEYTPPKATIAICTRDRTEDLRRCLDVLAKLRDDGQEIIVIDNCPSNSDTETLVKSYGVVRYVRENRPGLNIARNRALQEAKHEIVAFTDDDATPDADWLRALLINFSNPLVYCVTGLTMPLELETEAQEAFENYSPFGKGFYLRVFNSRTNNPLSTGQVGAGANMALRKSTLKDIGIFDEALDAGTPTQSGGDHEMFTRILLAGYSIVYDPHALSWHRHRRTWKELRHTLRGYGVGVYAFWTRTLFVEREWGVLQLPWIWFTETQFPHLMRSLFKKPGSTAKDLLLAELSGCLVGIQAYFTSKSKLKKNRHVVEQ